MTGKGTTPNLGGKEGQLHPAASATQAIFLGLLELFRDQAALPLSSPQCWWWTDTALPWKFSRSNLGLNNLGWAQGWPCFEHRIGLEPSWGPCRPELPSYRKASDKLVNHCFPWLEMMVVAAGRAPVYFLGGIVEVVQTVLLPFRDSGCDWIWGFLKKRASGSTKDINSHRPVS